MFDAISPEIPFGLVPQENTIYGSVTEAYDALRHPSVGVSLFVRGEVTLPVQHCLIARKGIQFADIERIVSHEQVCTLIITALSLVKVNFSPGARTVFWLHFDTLPRRHAREKGIYCCRSPDATGRRPPEPAQRRDMLYHLRNLV